ncbi:hypothetical protein BRADI_2g61365v3, partial [Brachypodium distachyon]
MTPKARAIWRPRRGFTGGCVAEPKKGKSKRTAAYAECEDKLLCEAWLKIGQDPVCGAEQKGQAYWKRIFDFFHEQQQFPPHSFASDQGELSLQKRWGLIQQECNKFAGANDHLRDMPLSGVGVKDLVFQVLEYFKEIHGKLFTMPHCWRVLKEAPKWQELYVSTKKVGSNGKKRDASTIDLEASGHSEAASRAVRLRERTNSKAASREASNLAFEETTKKILADKEAGREKFQQKREEQMNNYIELQKRKLAIE